MRQVAELNNHFYPSESEHSKQIETYFGTDKIANFSQKQNEFFKSIEITFICFVNRSGSTLFAELMSNYGYPTVKFLEPFNYDEVIKKAEASGITSFSEYLLTIIKENNVDNKLAIKISSNQLFWLSKNGFLSKFSKLNFIHVKRKDILKQAISTTIAIQTSKWLSFEKYDLSENQQQELLDKITNKSIVGAMKGIATSNALFDYFFCLHDIEPITVYYEELVGNQEKAIEHCLKCLKVPDLDDSFQPARTSMKPQYTDLNKKLERRFRKDFNLFEVEKVGNDVNKNPKYSEENQTNLESDAGKLKIKEKLKKIYS